MARYIRTDELLATARDGYHSDFGRSMADLTSLREVIEDTPTAEVAEVVRCSECKHLEIINKAPIYAVCKHEKLVFELWEADTRKHSCVDGERKKVE